MLKAFFVNGSRQVFPLRRERQEVEYLCPRGTNLGGHQHRRFGLRYHWRTG